MSAEAHNHFVKWIGEVLYAINQEFALAMVVSLAATLFRLEAASAGALGVVRHVSELEEILRNGIWQQSFI